MREARNGFLTRDGKLLAHRLGAVSFAQSVEHLVELVAKVKKLKCSH